MKKTLLGCFITGCLMVQIPNVKAMGDGDNLTKDQDGKSQSAMTIPIENIEDINAYLEALRKERDIELLRVEISADKKTATIYFHNPHHVEFQLNLFDLEGNLLRSYIGLTGEEVDIDFDGLSEVYYTYMLKDGKGTYYAGKLSLN